jgi:hypothetical protein
MISAVHIEPEFIPPQSRSDIPSQMDRVIVTGAFLAQNPPPNSQKNTKAFAIRRITHQRLTQAPPPP